MKAFTKKLSAFFCLFLLIFGSILLFQYGFGDQPPLDTKKTYFSSPDSKDAFEKISQLNLMKIRPRLKAFGDPKLNPAQNILSLLPMNMGLNPGYLFILNSIIQTLCGWLVYIILKPYFSASAVVAGTIIFVLNPTYLEWSANLLKDGIFISGCLLVLISLRGALNQHFCEMKNSFVQILALWSLGLYLVFKSRFYFLEIISVYGLSICGTYFIHSLREFKYKQPNQKVIKTIINLHAYFLSLVIFPVLLCHIARQANNQDLNFMPKSSVESIYFNQKLQNDKTNISEDKLNTTIINDINWKHSKIVPDFIENKMFMLSVRRQGFLNTAGHSKVDSNIKIQSTHEFINYFPRAFLNGWFSPFPNLWFQKGSSDVHTLGRKTLGIVTLLYWPLLLSGSFYFWENRKQLCTLLICTNCMVGVLFFAYTVPNIGALNRMRYGFYMLWIAFGTAYVTEYLLRRRS